MKKYQYQIVRYIHDRVTSEFVNVGIIVFQPESNFLAGKFISRYGRVSQFFNEIKGHSLIVTLKNIEHQVNGIPGMTGKSLSDHKTVAEITETILPKDDSALECSEVLYSLDIDPQFALSYLFDRLVNKYMAEPEPDINDDKHVWKSVYKEYFDRYNITPNLKAHSVKTANDVLEFDKSWKNGTWHCFQSLNFNLKRVDSIKNKAYKWSGIINELNKSDEALTLFLLAQSPQTHKTAKKFIEEILAPRHTDKISVQMIYENEAESFAQKVSEEMAGA